MPKNKGRGGKNYKRQIGSISLKRKIQEQKERFLGPTSTISFKKSNL